MPFLRLKIAEKMRWIGETSSNGNLCNAQIGFLEHGHGLLQAEAEQTGCRASASDLLMRPGQVPIPAIDLFGNLGHGQWLRKVGLHESRGLFNNLAVTVPAHIMEDTVSV